MATQTRPLFRAIGLPELKLLQETAMQSFPQRVFRQPIFYPALTESYARKLAQQSHTHDPHARFAGFVCTWQVQSDYLNAFAQRMQSAEGDPYDLWVPVPDLLQMNDHVVGPIKITEAFYGDAYEGETLDLENLNNGATLI